MINVEVLLNSRSFLLFKNESGELCNVTRRYGRDGYVYTITFNKDFVSLATRPVMRTKVAKKVNNFLMKDGFEIIK